MLTEASIQQFNFEGFLVLPRAIQPEQVNVMREECDQFVSAFEAEIDHEATGIGAEGRNDYGANRYVVTNHYRQSRLKEFIFGDIVAEICRATLGRTAYLFREQFVIVGPEKPGKCRWRRAADCMEGAHAPFITCWIAPRRCDGSKWHPAHLIPGVNGGGPSIERTLGLPARIRSSVQGAGEGHPLIAQAGSIAVFSSSVYYSLGCNVTQGWCIRAVLARSRSCEGTAD